MFHKKENFLNLYNNYILYGYKVIIISRVYTSDFILRATVGSERNKKNECTRVDIMRIYSHIICDFITRRTYSVTNYAKSMLENGLYNHHRPFI